MVVYPLIEFWYNAKEVKRVSTLVIVSHPEIERSTSQNFLKEALPTGEDQFTYHHLESVYPEGNINSRAEQELLRQHDRIILQFPLYWYQCPPMLKKWQDEVLQEGFAYGPGSSALMDKELGLVLSIGVAEREYQAGGRENFSISQLTIPFQALSHRLGMKFLKVFPIFQLSYQSEEDKMRLLIKYQQYLMGDNDESLKSREDWFIKAIEQTNLQTLPDNASFILDEMKDFIEDLQLQRLDLKYHQQLDWGGPRDE